MPCGQVPWFTTYGRCACSVKVRKPAGWDATLDDVCVTADHLGQRYLAFGTASSVRTAEWESTPNSDKRQTMFWSAVYRAQMRTAGLLWILLWSVHGTAPGGVSGSAERVGSGDTDGKGVLKVEVDQALGGDLNLLATSDGIGTGA